MEYFLEDDIELMCLKSANGPEGASEAFERLESTLPSLKGRKFYGISREDEHGMHYYACAAIERGDNPGLSGCIRLSIPSGKYEREKLQNWEGRTSDIKTSFERMSEGKPVDQRKWFVEYYRSVDTLYLMVPLK